MNVEDAVKMRRSVRSFQNREIEQEKLEKVLNCARMAPSASNKQDWKFVVVQDKEKRDKLVEAAHGQTFLGEAPVVIAGVSTNPDYIMRCDVPSGVVDLSIALDHITLKAAEEGLGTCWIGSFDQDPTRKILDIPDYCQVISLMPLGYPSRPLKIKGKNRKQFEEVVCWNTFSD